jgi:hypothetical protein
LSAPVFGQTRLHIHHKNATRAKKLPTRYQGDQAAKFASPLAIVRQSAELVSTDLAHGGIGDPENTFQDATHKVLQAAFNLGEGSALGSNPEPISAKSVEISL